MRSACAAAAIGGQAWVYVCKRAPERGRGEAPPRGLTVALSVCARAVRMPRISIHGSGAHKHTHATHTMFAFTDMYARARAGTGTVTLAALLAAARNAGSSIKDMRFICAGAGSAGLGVCAQVHIGISGSAP